MSRLNVPVVAAVQCAQLTHVLGWILMEMENYWNEWLFPFLTLKIDFFHIIDPDYDLFSL